MSSSDFFSFNMQSDNYIEIMVDLGLYYCVIIMIFL